MALRPELYLYMKLELGTGEIVETTVPPFNYLKNYLGAK